MRAHLQGPGPWSRTRDHIRHVNAPAIQPQSRDARRIAAHAVPTLIVTTVVAKHLSIFQHRRVYGLTHGR